MPLNWTEKALHSGALSNVQKTWVTNFAKCRASMICFGGLLQIEGEKKQMISEMMVPNKSTSNCAQTRKLYGLGEGVVELCKAVRQLQGTAAFFNS